VTSAGEVEAAFARVDAGLGTPQLVVACAGTAGVLGPLWLADPQQWWQAVAVDRRGTMLTAHCAIRRILAVGGGRLITVYGNLGDRQQGYVSAFAVGRVGDGAWREVRILPALDGVGASCPAMSVAGLSRRYRVMPRGTRWMVGRLYLGGWSPLCTGAGRSSGAPWPGGTEPSGSFGGRCG
jgi:NAD(P)-dependent dehydrogenase (short-subunit alcohol dehydrogenase family)